MVVAIEKGDHLTYPLVVLAIISLKSLAIFRLVLDHWQFSDQSHFSLAVLDRFEG